MFIWFMLLEASQKFIKFINSSYKYDRRFIMKLFCYINIELTCTKVLWREWDFLMDFLSLFFFTRICLNFESSKLLKNGPISALKSSLKFLYFAVNNCKKTSRKYIKYYDIERLLFTFLYRFVFGSFFRSARVQTWSFLILMIEIRFLMVIFYVLIYSV